MSFKIMRAREEIVRVNIESRRLWTWVNDEDRALTHVASSLRATDPHIASEMDRLSAQRRRVNNIHRQKLALLRSLQGYTGSWTPGVRSGAMDDGHPVPQVLEDEPEGAAEEIVPVLPDEDDALLDESLRYMSFVWSIHD